MVFNLAEEDTYGYECGVFILNDFSLIGFLIMSAEIQLSCRCLQGAVNQQTENSASLQPLHSYDFSSTCLFKTLLITANFFSKQVSKKHY